MTKAEQVRALDDGTRTSAEIGRAVGCHPAYVRALRGRVPSDRGGRLNKSLYFESWEDRKKRRRKERQAGRAA